MAYRLHKPEREEIVANPQDECEAVVALGNALAQAGPLQWRDRIREIDTMLADLRDERVKLVNKLSAEGLAMIVDLPL